MDSNHRKPRTGTAVMERFKELFFIGPNGEETGPHAQMEAGSKGRRRNLKDASSFLLYGVERCAMPDRYRPPSASIIEELVGKTTISAEERQTPALKPEQFTTLLDDLIKLDDNYPLMLATAVCGYVGCRPSGAGNARRAGWRGQGHQHQAERQDHEPAAAHPGGGPTGN